MDRGKQRLGTCAHDKEEPPIVEPVHLIYCKRYQKYTLPDEEKVKNSGVVIIARALLEN